jgi:hypothetical protein
MYIMMQQRFDMAQKTIRKMSLAIQQKPLFPPTDRPSENGRGRPTNEDGITKRAPRMARDEYGDVKSAKRGRKR